MEFLWKQKRASNRWQSQLHSSPRLRHHKARVYWSEKKSNFVSSCITISAFYEYHPQSNAQAPVRKSALSISIAPRATLKLLWRSPRFLPAEHERGGLAEQRRLSHGRGGGGGLFTIAISTNLHGRSARPIPQTQVCLELYRLHRRRIGTLLLPNLQSQGRLVRQVFCRGHGYRHGCLRGGGFAQTC
jgi:hypothetical protein